MIMEEMLKFERLEVNDDGNNEYIYSEDQKSSGSPTSSDLCNLIVNYLPHDVDDLSLKVCLFQISCYYLSSIFTGVVCFFLC
jgi:hypothetical protein